METLAAIVFLAISMVLGHCVAFNERRMPYQVIVRHDVVDKEVLDCSGVILGAKHVLTTAKCAEYITAADLSIKYGYKTNDSLYKTVEIEAIVKHPGFNARFYAHNIAVLITKTEMELQANIAEAIEIDEIKDDLSFFASGWGVTKVSATQHFLIAAVLVSNKLVIHVTIKLSFFQSPAYLETFPETLESQRVIPFSHFNCKMIGSKASLFMRGYSAICTRDIFLDIRPENMGSPLVSESNKLIGIASYFADTFEFNSVCVYLATNEYLPWIQSILTG